jgi:hypothetical protein
MDEQGERVDEKLQQTEALDNSKERSEKQSMV